MINPTIIDTVVYLHPGPLLNFGVGGMDDGLGSTVWKGSLEKPLGNEQTQ